MQQFMRCLRTRNFSLRAGIIYVDVYAGLPIPGFCLREVLITPLNEGILYIAHLINFILFFFLFIILLIRSFLLFLYFIFLSSFRFLHIFCSTTIFGISKQCRVLLMII
jgi:hypothetical protein